MSKKFSGRLATKKKKVTDFENPGAITGSSQDGAVLKLRNPFGETLSPRYNAPNERPKWPTERTGRPNEFVARYNAPNERPNFA